MGRPMNWFLREKPDGRLAAGYGIYLLGGLAAMVAVMALHRRFSASAGARSGGTGRPSHVAPITQSAAIMSRIEVKNPPPAPETRSYRLEKPAALPVTPSVSPPADSFDAIGAALAQMPPTDSKAGPKTGVPRSLDEEAAGRRRDLASTFPDLPPAFSGEPTASNARTPGYRDPLASPAPNGSPGITAAVAAIPRGTLICVYLLTTVDTSNPSAILQFAAARSLVFHHRRQIPFGTRFLGKLSGPPLRDRLNLAVGTVLYPDGLELPISATAVEADEGGGNIRPGVGALYFPPPAWVQLAPYLSDVVTGYLGLLETRAQPQLSVGLGGLSVQTAAASAEPSTAAYQASAQALQDFTQGRMKELAQRYASYYLIPAGTACWLQLETDLDLAAAGMGRRDREGLH
jgi:hypothetical protein